MSEFLSALLQAVLIAAVPMCAAFIGHGISAFARYIGVRTKNDDAKKYLADAADAITTAVSRVNQTYVDGLKKSGTFTKENQEEALSLAVKEAFNLMTHETIAFLKEAYGDMYDYLVSKIEAEVRLQKKNDPDKLNAPLEAIGSVTESPSTTAVAVAAASAAATVAATEAVRQTTASTPPGSPVEAPAEQGV